MEAVFIGLMTAFGLAISTGPVFLTLIQTSISKGFRIVVFFILGVSLADSSILFLCWFGLEKLSLGLDTSLIKLIAGFGLLGFGATFFLKKEEKTKESDMVSDNEIVLIETKDKRLVQFGRGLLINLLNPIVWAFWAGISQFSITKFSDKFDQIVYFCSILATVLLTDLLKGFFAEKLKPFFTSSILKWFNRGIGILLMGLGIKFLLEYFELF